MSEKLAFCNQEWLGGIIRGFYLLVLGLGVLAAMSVLPFTASFGFFQGDALPLLTILGSTFLVIGAFNFTARERRRNNRIGNSRSRHLLRILILAWVAFMISHGISRPSLLLTGAVLHSLLASIVASLAYVRWLAARSANPGLQQLARILYLAFSSILLIWVIDSIIGLLAGNPDLSGWSPLAGVRMLSGCALVPLGIGYIVLLFFLIVTLHVDCRNARKLAARNG
ncbi:MAG TPA: hypothetical protein VNT79_00240 [Phycisphaerae bacterium]|nr:hypothetical protein [Phycisphaerae bacterium]